MTSDTYQRCFTLDGITYHHILDPQTGLPADTGLVSASIVAESSMTADALATACIVLGLEESIPLLEQLGLEGMFIDAEGNISVTPGFTDQFPVQTAG